MHQTGEKTRAIRLTAWMKNSIEPTGEDDNSISMERERENGKEIVFRMAFLRSSKRTTNLYTIISNRVLCCTLLNRTNSSIFIVYISLL